LPLEGAGSLLTKRGVPDNALNWCREKKNGVPLWYPNSQSNWEYLSEPGEVHASDVRESLLVGGPTGQEKSTPVLQARLAAMAAWAKVSHEL
jgi:hypothetical protein